MRLIQCANIAYSHEIICVEISPANPRRSLGRRLLFSLSHFSVAFLLDLMIKGMMAVRTTSA